MAARLARRNFTAKNAGKGKTASKENWRFFHNPKFERSTPVPPSAQLDTKVNLSQIPGAQIIASMSSFDPTDKTGALVRLWNGPNLDTKREPDEAVFIEARDAEAMELMLDRIAEGLGRTVRNRMIRTADSKLFSVNSPPIDDHYLIYIRLIGF